jgi:hypothetical protein
MLTDAGKLPLWTDESKFRWPLSVNAFALAGGALDAESEGV